MPCPKKIYPCGKTSTAEVFRQLRADGFPIKGSWIDGVIADETPESTAKLWHHNIIPDVRDATHLLLYWPKPEPLRGALVEIGAILCHGKPVLIVTASEITDETLHNMLGTWIYSSLVTISRKGIGTAIAEWKA